MSPLAATVADADRTTRRARRVIEDAVFDAVAAGRSQRDIAAEIDRSQPEIGRLLARARRRRSNPTAADVALDVADELARGDEDFAFRLVRAFVQRVATAPHEELDRLLREPPRTGDRRWDTLFAGAVAWACGRRGVDVPRWSAVTPLETFWSVRPEPALAGLLLQRTPSELAVLGVWIDADSLTGC